MSSSAMDAVTPSTNNKMLSEELDNIVNQLVKISYPDLENYSFIRPLEGVARTKYGDYECLSVLEVCEELREMDPDLFVKNKPKQIAEKILGGFRSDMNMINYESLTIHAAGIITFKLHGSWIAQRIHNMLSNGIDTWAPIIFEGKARAVLVSLTKTNTCGDITPNMLRADCIKQALVRTFSYSGFDVLDACSVSVDLKTIRDEFHLNKEDVIVNLNPHQDRKYIQECFTAARKEWLQSPQLTCCGYRTFNGDQKEKLDFLWQEYFYHHRFTSLFELARNSGYTPDEFFGCLLKYTWLKSHRLVDFTFNIEEMLQKEGNSLVYLLSTSALVRSVIEKTGILYKEKEALAGKGERELGLHLVEFTEVIGEACKAFMPHIVCQYIFDLSVLFISYYREVRPGEAKLELCMATEAVMNKCFYLLGINPGCSFGHLAYGFVKETREAVNHIIPSPFEARYSRSRFELFTMSVSVSDPNFGEPGSIFGELLVKDALEARADGWKQSDEEDSCYVSCFDHEWYEPLGIGYDSLIPFGDPSCRRSVPVSSSVEVDLLLHAMSKDKDQCYLIFHGKRDISLKFWEEKPKTKCGTLKFNSHIGRVLVNFILLKEAVDASMELTMSNPSVVPIQICGSILAYYGGDVVKDDLLGQYKATIFRTSKFELIGEQVVSLHRSLLAVPADGCLKIEALLRDVESGKEYVNETRDYHAKPGKADNLCAKCGNFSFNLKVAWS